MRDLEYMWRLDTDSKILQPINYDVFMFMRVNGFKYGYNWIEDDQHTLVLFLWEATCK